MPTKEEIQAAVSATFGNSATDDSVTYTLAREGTGGFLAAVQFLKITKNDGTQIPVVLKMPDMSKINAYYASTNAQNTAAGANYVSEAHDTEASFLKLLSCPEITGSDNPFPWLTRVYAAKYTTEPEGAYMFIEDLSGTGKTPDDIEPVPDKVLFGVIDALADLAVVSLANPESLKLVKQFTAIHDAFCSDVKLAVETLSKDYPGQFRANPADLMGKFDLQKYLAFIDPERGNKYPILVHRDVFPRNILVDKENPQNFLALIDWQLGGMGQPGEDLARLLITSLDRNERKSKEQGFLKFYFEQIVTKSRAKGVQVPFGFEDAVNGYKGAFRYNALLFCDHANMCLQSNLAERPDQDKLRFLAKVYENVKDAFEMSDC